MELAGAHVFVTGGSRGIGAALAREFAARGATVSITARSEGLLQGVADEIGGNAFVADLRDDADVDGLIARVEAETGPIDVLVNNAGVETSDQFARTDPGLIRDVARINFEVPLLLTRQVVRGMHERGRGHLVFVSSIAGSAGFPSLAAYSGTKAGINNFVATMRIELRGTAIGTTIVAPGPVDTRMWDSLEDSPYTVPLLRRLRRLFLIPKISPEHLAERAVDGVEANRRHVRYPKRLLASFVLPEVPRRINEAVFTGIDFELPPPPDA